MPRVHTARSDEIKLNNVASTIRYAQANVQMHRPILGITLYIQAYHSLYVLFVRIQ